MRWFSNLVLRQAQWVVLIGTILSVLGGYYSVQLYKNLRTEIFELLPTTAPSVIDLHRVSERLDSIDNLAILVFSKKTQASKKFVIDLAGEISKVSKNIISSVDYRMDRELQFFRERAALYMDLADLVQIRDYIHQRIEYEKDLYNPLNIFSHSELLEPWFDFNQLRKKYEKKASSYSRLPSGFYASPDETVRVVMANMPGETTGFDGANKVKSAVEEIIKKLDPKKYAEDIEIKYTGGVQDMIEEQTALVADLELSTVLVTLIVTLGMLLFYRTLRATFALVLSLFFGTFWTFGVSYFAVGYLNANSAFLGSIVIGNGINFGIIYLARYLEERRAGRNHLRASKTAISQTATATWTAALAAGLSYGSLVLTSFRGFKQFGIIGLIGMVLCWISAFTILPALLTIFETMKPLVKKSAPRKALIGESIAFLVQKFPKLIWGVSLGFTALSLVLIFKPHTVSILETDLSKLRNKESITHGSGYLLRYPNEIFQHYLSPLVVLPESRQNAKKISTALKKIQSQEGEDSMIASVQTIDDFIPSDQAEKIKVLHGIRKLLPKRILKRLSAADLKQIQDFLNPTVFKPVAQADLPPLVISKFTEKDGTIGKMVVVEPPLSQKIWNGENLIHFIGMLRSTAHDIEPGAALAGTTAITSDMIKAISYDGPRATLFAFLAVVLLVVILFRNAKTISWILLSLVIGVIWLAGLTLIFHWKINFLNFIALPITFGIGVDYGVNIFQRYQESQGKDILKTIRHTASAVALCSFSTIIGYTSLLIAGNQGFVSFGLLAVAGEITCVIAALVALPAFLLIRARGRTVQNLPDYGKAEVYDFNTDPNRAL